MTTDPTIREQSYAYFLQEAPELLQVLEQGLLSLREDHNITKIHNLMRTTHTLKGAAASMGLESIKTVAHSLEDIFKALYKPDIKIDAEIEALLFEGYECLRAPLMAQLTGSPTDESEVFDQAATIFTRLQDKLGNCFGQEAYIPTSLELGFDVTQSIFEMGVTSRLEQIAEVLTSEQPQAVASTLQAQAEVFLGLAESLNLPGFKAIAEATITALARYPDHAVAIAQAALTDFQHGQAEVLAGDRTQGGRPNLVLQQLSEGAAEGNTEVEEVCETESATAGTDYLLETIWNVSSTSEEDEAPVSSTTEHEVAINSEEITKNAGIVNQDPYFPTQSQPSTAVRVNVEHLERLNYLIGELLTNQSRQSSQDAQILRATQELVSQLRQHQQMLNQLRDCLELDRYGELHTLLQSLLENVAQLARAADTIDLSSRQSSQILEKQNRLLTNARDDLYSVRMLPLSDIFNRLPGILKQLETLQDKQVTLKFSGTEILVDKAVAGKLYEPLLHLVRNAFDHGIEPVEVRQQQGKIKQGQIEIRAFHRGSHLLIEVQDDGQGIKFAQVRQQAVERNLISREQAHNLNEVQLIDLLFEPGFSTASQVNDLSGRGFGLDVVRAHLQELRGSVTVHSEPNQGTTFLLQIPFSLTMANLFLCQAGFTSYALLTDAIEQIIIPRSEQINCWQGGKVLRWGKGNDERLIPVYNLASVLNYSSPLTTTGIELTEILNVKNFAYTAPALMPVVLLRCQDRLLGLEVNQLIGEQELVVRPLGPMIVPPPYVYGGSILADGKLALVFDGAALVKYVFDQQNRASMNKSVISFTPPISTTNLPSLLEHDLVPKAIPAATKLLVVDDSISLRQTLALTLQNFGYEVFQAENGHEAIEQLRLQPAISLVICDIEMPQMNGFEFLNYRRQDLNLAKIPVVILTSQSGEKPCLLAQELGAAAYINKPYSDQQLLSTVADLLYEQRG